MAYDPAGEAEPIKVFLSYSRADTGFALELVSALQACGFEAFIDQEDIAPGEPWEQRLGGLIESADTVVYILSPDSLTSEHCSWEVDETLRLNKRLIPVVWRPVADGQVPKELSQLNYVFFDGEKSFAAGLKDLSAALRVDHKWIREHTRLGALARRWDGRGRTEALLLRGDELEAASSWMASRPHGAPLVSDAQMDFIGASNAAADAADRAARNRRRGLLLAVSAVALAMTGLAGFSALSWYGAVQSEAAAVRSAEAAAQAQRAAALANLELAAANLRLSSDIALRAPATGSAPFETRGGWFPVAANYAGAVVQLRQGRQIVTGILVDGAMVHPAWAGTSYLLTPRFRTEAELIEADQRLDAFLEATDALGAAGAEEFEGDTFDRSFVVPSDISAGVLEQRFVEPGDLPQDVLEKPFVRPADTTALPDPSDPDFPHEMMEQRYVTPEELMPVGEADAATGTGGDETILVSFPTLAGAGTLEIAAAPVWRTPLELAAEPVFNLFALEGELPFGTRPLVADDIDCARDPWAPTGGGRFALFGIDGAAASGIPDVNPGLSPFNVFVGDEDIVSADGAEQLTLLVTEGITIPNADGMTYRHATLKGAFGAPVFDLDSKKVVGVHQGVIATRQSANGRAGIAEPIRPLIDLIREDVSIDRGDADRTPPLCIGAP